MNNISTSEIGVRTVNFYYASGDSITNENTLTKSTQSVSGGTIRKGDGKSPLPWNYRYQRNINLNGRTTRNNTDPRRHVSGVLSSSTGLTSAQIESAIGDANAIAQRAWVDSLYDRLREGSDLGSSAVEAYTRSATNKVNRLTKIADEARRKSDQAFLRSNGGRGKVRFYTREPDRRRSTYDMATAWLSLKYKWLPIVSDIYSVAREATGTMARKGFQVKVSGSGSSGIDDVTLSADSISYGKVAVRGQAEVGCLGSFRFVVNTAGDALARLTSLDPAVLAWNALPYSFVVDWVYDIGGYLRDLETRALYASAFKGGYVSTRTRLNASINHSGKSTVGETFIHCNSSVTIKRMSRVIYTSLPRPGRPQIDFELSAHQLLSAAALLRVKLKP